MLDLLPHLKTRESHHGISGRSNRPSGFKTHSFQTSLVGQHRLGCLVGGHIRLVLAHPASVVRTRERRLSRPVSSLSAGVILLSAFLPRSTCVHVGLRRLRAGRPRLFGPSVRIVDPHPGGLFLAGQQLSGLRSSVAIDCTNEYINPEALAILAKQERGASRSSSPTTKSRSGTIHGFWSIGLRTPLICRTVLTHELLEKQQTHRLYRTLLQPPNSPSRSTRMRRSSLNSSPPSVDDRSTAARSSSSVSSSPSVAAGRRRRTFVNT